MTTTPHKPFNYWCTIRRIVDGDTVDVDIDLGFGMSLNNERVRLIGIDTPEKRTSDPYEKVFGIYATDYVTALLPVGSKQILASRDFKGKFGRVLGDFVVPGEGMLVAKMIKEHVGVAYNGQSKDEISEAHKQNYEWLVKNNIVVL